MEDIQFYNDDLQDFESCNDGESQIEEAAMKYEKIFEEIQNYEIDDSALDKIEEVFDENLKLKHDNIEMKKQIEDLKETLDVQNFKNVNESLKKRQSSNHLFLEELKTQVINSSSIVRNKAPPPPPPPMLPSQPQTPMSYKPKYRILF